MGGSARSSMVSLFILCMLSSSHGFDMCVIICSQWNHYFPSRFGYATLEYLNQSWARFECIHTGRAERRNLQSFNENTTDIVYIYNQYFME